MNISEAIRTAAEDYIAEYHVYNIDDNGNQTELLVDPKPEDLAPFIQSAINAETAALREELDALKKRFAHLINNQSHDVDEYYRDEPAEETRPTLHECDLAAKDAEIAQLKLENDGLRHARATLRCEIEEMKNNQDAYCECLDAEIARLKEQIENRTVLESYLPIFKKLAGTGYDIATSGFCEDVCNALKQRSDKAELVEALKIVKEYGCHEAAMKFVNAALKKVGVE